MSVKKVIVLGCYDMFYSGYIAFFRAATEYGDLYVGIGSDATVQTSPYNLRRTRTNLYGQHCLLR